MGAQISDVFRAIADETRREILVGLAAGPRMAGDICKDFDISQPAVSAHLEVLRTAGLVHVRAEGRHRVYSLEPAPLEQVDEWIGELRTFWKRRLTKLGERLDERAGKERSKRGS